MQPTFWVSIMQGSKNKLNMTEHGFHYVICHGENRQDLALGLDSWARPWMSPARKRECVPLPRCDAKETYLVKSLSHITQKGDAESISSDSVSHEFP